MITFLLESLSVFTLQGVIYTFHLDTDNLTSYPLSLDEASLQDTVSINRKKKDRVMTHKCLRDLSSSDSVRYCYTFKQCLS